MPVLKSSFYCEYQTLTRYQNTAARCLLKTIYKEFQKFWPKQFYKLLIHFTGYKLKWNSSWVVKPVFFMGDNFYTYIKNYCLILTVKNKSCTTCTTSAKSHWTLIQIYSNRKIFHIYYNFLKPMCQCHILRT